MPASSQKVPAKSIGDTISPFRLPGLITPGQRIRRGVRRDSHTSIACRTNHVPQGKSPGQNSRSQWCSFPSRLPEGRRAYALRHHPPRRYNEDSLLHNVGISSVPILDQSGLHFLMPHSWGYRQHPKVFFVQELGFLEHPVSSLPDSWFPQWSCPADRRQGFVPCSRQIRYLVRAA